MKEINVVEINGKKVVRFRGKMKSPKTFRDKKNDYQRQPKHKNANHW